MIGGSWPGAYSNGRKEIVPKHLQGNLQQAVEVMPSLSSIRLRRAWSGLNPTSDGFHTVGEVSGMPGFFILQSEAGYSLGFVVAQLLAELVTGREPSLPVAPFSPSRFA